MDRPMSAKEVRRLIDDHQRLKTMLAGADVCLERYRQEIRKASDAMAVQESRKVLRELPVEEINREKKGYRVKALRDDGYESIADLTGASVRALASVRGISEEAARAIRQTAEDIAQKAQKNAKIRLDTDHKTAAAARLVAAISGYRRSRPLVEDCRRILEEYSAKIDYALEEAESAASNVRWVFLSSSDKQLAAESCEYLWRLITEEYGQRAIAALRSLADIERSDASVAWKDFEENSIQFFNILEDVNPGVLGTDDSVYGLPENLALEIQAECIFTEGLRCTLRRYQEWGVKYILHQKRVLLGDEMGLGKTVQAIAAMVSLHNTGDTHFVVVCPAGILTNWCREIEKMSTLPVTRIHGTRRADALREWLAHGGVAVTTYETTGSFGLDEDFRFAMLVVDEAHYIKSPGARRTANVKKLSFHAQRLLFMTGTALENKVEEMVALIRILQPAVASQVYGMEFLSSAPEFRERVAPVYYRRRREDVLTELPELVESREWCALLPEEERVYERAILRKRYAEARRVSWNVEDLDNSSKAKRFLALLEQAEEDGRKIIAFSWFLDTIRKVARLAGTKCLPPIVGAVPPRRRQEIIDAFDAAPAGAVLVAQIQSGGVGLNIQSASVVILCEPQFKPSIENQAISRAYRMGQTRSVLVYRLLCEDTVDEKIMEVLEGKQALFDAFADQSVVAEESRELDEKTFGAIMDEEFERISAKYGKSAEEGKASPSE